MGHQTADRLLADHLLWPNIWQEETITNSWMD